VAEDLARRSGWITFAGVIALVAGGYNALSGIAALADDDTLAARATEVLYGIDLTAWGWFWLIVGVVQLVTGVLILGRSIWGLWLGVGIARQRLHDRLRHVCLSAVGDRGPAARLPCPLRAADSERRVHVMLGWHGDARVAESRSAPPWSTCCSLRGKEEPAGPSR
jgi:hypothetical protein